MNRPEEIQHLQDRVFDLCIIGAGASGAGAALDAALRGMTVVLIDRDDFASGTSSKSTKLIHGGVRYLEQAFKNLDFAQLKQVRHGLEERHIVLSNAPHLARPLALITPVFSWIEGLYYAIGLNLYALFASKKDTLPGSKWLGKKETLARMPSLTTKLHGSVLYYDGQLDDARYALALVQTAHKTGATVVNHAELTAFEKDTNGQLQAATVTDRLSGHRHRIQAKVFLNCTGPYSDAVRLMANPDAEPRIRPSKGVHAVLPFSVLNSEDALLIPKTRDGRVVFAVPFEGQMLLGTTDDEYKDVDTEPTINRAEIDYLLETLEPYLAQKTLPSVVKSGFGGLRPLIKSVGKATKGLLRDHEVESDEQSGLVSLLGGKWTTYRLMAKDAIDAVAERLGITDPCTTDRQPLSGAEYFTNNGWQQLQLTSGLAEDICHHLHHNYGSNALTVLKIVQNTPFLGDRLVHGYPYIAAEVVYATQQEMCCTIRDFMARRIRLEIVDWQAAREATPRVAALMAPLLGWSEMEEKRQVETYVKRIFLMMSDE